MVFREGCHLASGEMWYLIGITLEAVNQCKYLRFVLTSKLSINATLEDILWKGKQGGVHILRAQSVETPLYKNGRFYCSVGCTGTVKLEQTLDVLKQGLEKLRHVM